MFRKLAPHAVIILCAMYFVFFFIDRVNASMAFIDNGITKGLLFALCVLAIWESVLLIRDNRRREAARRRPAGDRTAGDRTRPQQSSPARTSPARTDPYRRGADRSGARGYSYSAARGRASERRR